VFASQKFTSGSFAIEMNVTTVDVDSNPGGFSAAAVDANGEAVAFYFYKSGSQVYYTVFKVEPGTPQVKTVLVSPTAVTLPALAAITSTQTVNAFYFYLNSTYLGSLSETNYAYPMQVGVEADSGSGGYGTAGEGTFSVELLTGWPSWTVVPQSFTLTAKGSGTGSTSQLVSGTGNLGLGSNGIGANIITNGGCGNASGYAYLVNDLSIYAGGPPVVGSPLWSSGEIGGSNQYSCNSAGVCGATMTQPGTGMTTIPIVTGNTYTVVSKTSAEACENPSICAPQVTWYKTVQLNP
jgi:hypothetical protein